MPFAIKIHGTNGARAYCYPPEKYEQRFWADPSRKTGWGWVNNKGDDMEDDYVPERAQFKTYAEAVAVATACRWTNQRFSIHVVRGRANAHLTKHEVENLVSCS